MAKLPTTGQIAVLSSSRAVTRATAAMPLGIIGVVMLGNFLGPLYSSTANVIVPNLIASFGSDVDTMEWVVTGYMLGYSIAMPLAGWLADTYGRRRMYLLGLAMFVTFSVGASLAWDTSSLIAFRILQAVGGGIISPTGMAIVTDVVPPAQRGKALGLWGMGMMLAPAFGPWISGLIVDNLNDWRLVFWLGVPIGILGFIISAIVLPKGEDVRTTRASFDIIGFATLSGSLACFLIPLTQGNRVGWDDSSIIVSFVASVVLFAAFIWQELHVKAPMLDLRLFSDSIFSIAVSLRALLGLGYYFAIFLLPLFTQDLLGWDATQSGAVLVPAGLAMGLLMPISGTISDRIGARPLVLAGAIVAAYGTFLFAQLDMTWDADRIALFNTIRTGALGLLFTPLTAAALMNVPRMRVGAASGILNTVWQVGGSLGIAVGETFLDSRVAQRYSDLVSAAVPSSIPFMNGLHQTQAMLSARGLNPGVALAMMQQVLLRNATVQAYGDTFMLGAFTIAISIPIAFFLKNHVKKAR